MNHNEMSLTKQAYEHLVCSIENPDEPEIEREYVGMLRVMPATRWNSIASTRPNPDQLWGEFWYEGEVCCLFADSNLGKSILAVQIAEEIARRQTVIYFDFELTDKQFQLRCSDESGTLHDFPERFLRAQVDTCQYQGEDFEDAIIRDIEQCAVNNDARVLIVDNLTWLCNSSEKGDAAGELMMRLVQLKKKYGWSILVIAHTPKRMQGLPLTANDLAGSKKLFNFFDSVFAMGQSATDHTLRYIKQLKVRNGEFHYGADNVMLGHIVKPSTLAHFEWSGFGKEKTHLKLQDAEVVKRDQEILEMRREGLSIRDIAELMEVSKSLVDKVIRRA